MPDEFIPASSDQEVVETALDWYIQDRHECASQCHDDGDAKAHEKSVEQAEAVWNRISDGDTIVKRRPTFEDLVEDVDQLVEEGSYPKDATYQCITDVSIETLAHLYSDARRWADEHPAWLGYESAGSYMEAAVITELRLRTDYFTKEDLSI